MRSLLWVVAFALCICGCSAIKVPGITHRRARLVCITCCVNEPFFKQVKRGAMDAAKRMDVECEFIGTPAVDVPSQVQMTRSAVLHGYDGIALNIIDPHAFDGIISEAQARGIAVVAFNLNAQPDSRIATVGHDLYRAGYAAGEAARPMIENGSELLVTGHSHGEMAADDRYRGFFDALKNKDLTYTLVVTSGNVKEVEQRVTEAMLQHPRARTIIASGLSNTEGAGHAVDRAGKKGEYTVIGFDDSPEVQRLMRDGVVAFTVDQQAYAQGYYAVMQLALQHQRGIVPGDVNIPPRVLRAQRR